LDNLRGREPRYEDTRYCAAAPGTGYSMVYGKSCHRSFAQGNHHVTLSDIYAQGQKPGIPPALDAG